MQSRIFSTAVLVLLSAGAFLAQAKIATTSDGSMFLVFGILWLGAAVVNWFVWETLRDGWRYRRRSVEDDADLPLTGWFWPEYFKDFSRLLHPERHGADRPDRGARD